jgi:hypothetical protein
LRARAGVWRGVDKTSSDLLPSSGCGAHSNVVVAQLGSRFYRGQDGFHCGVDP